MNKVKGSTNKDRKSKNSKDFCVKNKSSRTLERIWTHGYNTNMQLRKDYEQEN